MRDGAVVVLSGDADLQSALEDWLRGAGNAVAPASDPRPRVIVADLDSLPRGSDLARLRTRHRLARWVLISGSPLAGDYLVAPMRDAAFLAMPFLPRALAAAVAG